MILASSLIGCSGSLYAAAVIYEPFNYAAGNLNGASGGGEVGLNGAWVANTDSKVVAGDLTYGTLSSTGGSVGGLNANVNRFGGARAISTSALAGNGLLDDGATLWFSLEVGYGTGGNTTNARLGFALANSQFSASNFRYNINDEAAQLGRGLGLTLGRFPLPPTNAQTNGVVTATLFRDATTGTGFAGNVFGTSTASLYGAGQYGLIVGKITWGAGATDTIELYQPSTSLSLGPVISTLTVDVDQSTFDTITWARGDLVLMDEIRFGATYADVTPVPEPSSLGLLSIAGLVLLRRRR